MNRPTCKTCPYFDRGFCQRNPPQVTTTETGPFYSRWPEVTEDDFCGEHPQFPAYLASLSPCESEAEKP